MSILPFPLHLFDNNIMRHSLLLLFGFFTPLFAFAYLDPGTGSFIIHIIVGGLVGISYGVRVFWRPRSQPLCVGSVGPRRCGDPGRIRRNLRRRIAPGRKLHLQHERDAPDSLRMERRCEDP